MPSSPAWCRWLNGTGCGRVRCASVFQSVRCASTIAVSTATTASTSTGTASRASVLLAWVKSWAIGGRGRGAGRGANHMPGLPRRRARSPVRHPNCPSAAVLPSTAAFPAGTGIESQAPWTRRAGPWAGNMATVHAVPIPVTVVHQPAWQAWRLLHVGFVLAPLLAGLDKFAHVLTDWTRYLAPVVPRVTGIQAGTFMQLVGIVEVVA